jgi:hypothetical protein
MSGEDSTGQKHAHKYSTGAALHWMLVLVALLAFGAWLFFRIKASQKPPATGGLKVVESVVHLPAGSFKTLDLLLPCAGTLSLDVMVQKGNSVGVFVVAPDQVAKMNAKQTFAHMTGFDANQTREYHRNARLNPGKYCLVLMDRSSETLSASTSQVLVNARLGTLR